MNTISPKPPISDPQYPEGEVERVSPGSLVVKDGKTYKVEAITVSHHLLWRIWQGVQAFFLIVASLGVGLAFKTWRQAVENKLDFVSSGKERIFIHTLQPPEVAATVKTSTLGKKSVSQIPEKVEAEPVDLTWTVQTISGEVNVRSFLDKAKKDIKQCSFEELEKGFYAALKIGFKISNSDDKTTLFEIAESIAQDYIRDQIYYLAFRVRFEAAKAIGISSPLANLNKDIVKADNKFGLQIQPLDTSLFKNQSMRLQKRHFSDGTTRLQIDAQLNHHARERLNPILFGLSSFPDFLMKEFPEGFCKGIKVTNEPIVYVGREDAGQKKMGR